MAVSGIGVSYAIAGTVIFWSGFTGNSITDTLKDFLKGAVPAHISMSAPSIGVNDNSSGSSTGGTAASASGTSSGIANDALKYVGHAYLYGGAPGPSGTKPWDCSSFVNWVLWHDAGMSIPVYGKKWNPSTHGPATGDYLLWSGAKTVSHNAKDAQAGDLCVWQTHMGIATGGGNMVSALNESLGTKATTISGGAPGGELLFVRRINGS